MSMFPGDMSSRIRAYESGLGPNPFQRNVPDVMPMQPRGGIAGLFERLRRPQFPPMGGFGGGRFGPPPFFPGMRGGFPGRGGGFFGGFRPRLRRRRRPRPQMPDYSKQFSSLEAKIAELQKQLAERQAATPTPDPVMDVAEPRPPMQVGTLGGTGYGRYPLGTAGPEFLYDDAGNPILEPPTGLKTKFPIGGTGPGNISIPNISDGRLDALDLADIEERIANLNIDVGGEGGRPDMPLPRIFERGPGDGKVMQRPPSIARLPNITPDPVKPTRGPARLEPIKMPPLPMPGGEIIDVPPIPDEILRDVQSRGTVGPGMVPPMPQADPNLLERFNTNPASVNFGLTATFDPDTGEYVTDLSSMGFQGAKRFRRQSPAEFAAQLAPDPAPASTIKPPRQDAIKVPIKMPPMPMIPTPMPDPMPMPRMPAPMPSMPAPMPSMPAPMPRLPRVGMAGPGPRIR